MAAAFDFVADRFPELLLRLGEHLMLTGVSAGAAILIGLPLGVLAARAPRVRGAVTGGVSILQTIPSLAMLAILLVLFGRIGALPAIVALTLYALLPIVRNTLTGILGVPAETVEAARGIGMTPRQRLWLVELPLATPVIVAGVRTAAVVGVGIATLSAFIGAGGLGQFINRGLSLHDTRLILLGAVPAASLALVVDGAIAGFRWGLVPKRSRTLGRFGRVAALSLPLLLAAGGFLAWSVGSARPGVGAGPREAADLAPDDLPGGVLRIGTKNFTEQFVLGELMAQLVEGRTGLTVERRFNLGGTMICHEALVGGGIDVYPEYTGTALTAILKHGGTHDGTGAYLLVAREYRRELGVEWLPPFGFDNTYTITVRRSFAEEHGLASISDLAEISSDLRAGFTAEFAERPDGLPGLRETYGLSFGDVRDLEPTLMYTAIAEEEVDVICAFATDGRIRAYDLETLEDDEGFFPPYEAAPLVRSETLAAHPEVGETLGLLAGRLDDATMQRLNYEVDENRRSPAEVAREFLLDEGLLPR